MRRRSHRSSGFARWRGWLAAPALLLAGVVLAAVPERHDVPTFSKDVAPIFYAHCVSCHREGEIGGKLSLLNYESAHAKATAIRERVEQRLMPPWPADPEGSLKFRNDARLSEREIATIVAWSRAGAPQGDPVDLPAAPAATEGWHGPDSRKPDAIVTLPAYTVRPAVVVPYIQQLIKIPYGSDRWVSAIELRAGNRALLHHMGITEVSLPEGMSAKDLEAFTQATARSGVPNPALANVRPVVNVPDAAGGYDMFGVYTPGTTFESYAPGSARLLRGGQDLYLNFNIHYTALDQEQTDLSQLGLWFQAAAPEHQLYRAPAAVKSLLANGRELLTDDPGTKAEGTAVAIPPIAPFTAQYELIGLQAYTQPVTYYQFQPHAHLRARDFTYVVVYPDGREQQVLSVPHYSFDWQIAYELASPLHLPAGSKLIVTAHYDNSARNRQLKAHDATDPLHKCAPDKSVYFENQNQSWDEMFSPLIQYSIDTPSAEAAATPGTTHAAATKVEPLPLVEVVGCLRSDSMRQWRLEDAAAPLSVRSQASSHAELEAAAGRAAGAGSYALLGVNVFDPKSHVGGRVAVRGVLISEAQSPRLNVTSLQSLPGSCH